MYSKTFKYKLTFALLCVLICTTLCSCTAFKSSNNDALPQLYPNDGIIRKLDVTLYMQLLDYNYLAGIATSITLSANEPPEEAILRALLGKKTPSSVATAAIPSDVSIDNVSKSGNIIYVTLNMAILQSQNFISGGYSRALAIYSIVNTLTKYSPQCSVQILVDSTGDGIGERVSYAELGIVTKPGSALAEPLPFISECVIDGASVTKFALSALVSHSYERAAMLMCSHSGAVTSDVLATTFENSCSLASFSLSDLHLSYSGDTAYVLVDLAFYNKHGEKKELNKANLPLFLSDGILKVSYDELMALLGEGS